MTTLKMGSRGEAVKELQKTLHLYEDGIFGTLTERGREGVSERNGLTVDGIVGEKTWANIQGKSTGLQKSKRTINEIIVHCSATVEGKNYTVDDITRWHKAQGWSTIGYHYVVYRDGSVHAGRDVDVAGAHCVGHNSKSIGVCYIGGLATDGKTVKDTRTEAQKGALVTLLKELRRLYPSVSIHGHREFANKACPCFDARKEYSSL